MENAQLRVKLDKNINKLYRQLDKQNISATDKINLTIKAIDKLIDGGDAETDTEKLVKELIYDPFGKSFSMLDVVGNLYNRADAQNGHGLGIVLTPSMVTNLMCDLIDVNSDSHVLDLCTGAGAFPVAAINHGTKNILALEYQPQMAELAKENIKLSGVNPDSVHVTDSFKYDKFDDFKADRLLLNPPYSYDQKGQPFLKLGLDHLQTGGLAAIIIMSKAGNGGAAEINKEILKGNTLLASVEMPEKLFYPSASVSTCIYVLRHGRPHDFDNDKVKFIKFSDDGFNRTKRTFNINGSNDPDELYDHILSLYRYGKDDNNGQYDDEYIEDTITDNGDDWNFDNHHEMDLRAKPEDFYKVVKDYQDFLFDQWRKDVDERMLKKLRGEPIDDKPKHRIGQTWPEYVEQVFSNVNEKGDDNDNNTTQN